MVIMYIGCTVSWDKHLTVLVPLTGASSPIVSPSITSWFLRRVMSEMDGAVGQQSRAIR